MVVVVVAVAVAVAALQAARQTTLLPAETAWSLGASLESFPTLQQQLLSVERIAWLPRWKRFLVVFIEDKK